MVNFSYSSCSLDWKTNHHSLTPKVPSSILYFRILLLCITCSLRFSEFWNCSSFRCFWNFSTLLCEWDHLLWSIFSFCLSNCRVVRFYARSVMFFFCPLLFKDFQASSVLLSIWALRIRHKYFCLCLCT